MRKNKSNELLADKTEYLAIDFLKFGAAYLVMAIHFLIFEDINKELNFWFIQVVCRLAVPFYFLTAGYFVGNKLSDKDKTFAYLKRVLFMYLIYTVFYVPFIVEEYQNAGYSFWQGCISFLKDFLLVGSYYHLWYFGALIVAVAFLYLMINRLKLSDKKILIITGLLYCLGTLGNAYRNVWKKYPVMESIFSTYESVFKTTVNGIFFGVFLVALGYCVRKYNWQIRYKRYWLYAIILFFIMNVEEYFARRMTWHSGQSMLFITPWVVLAVFLAACFIQIPKKLLPVGVFLRNMSVIIYGFHIFIHLQYGPELSGNITYGFLYYLMIAKRITIVAFVVVGLSRIKFFSWLKYLY